MLTTIAWRIRSMMGETAEQFDRRQYDERAQHEREDSDNWLCWECKNPHEDCECPSNPAPAE